MSIHRLDVSLDQYDIGLSGAIPDRGDWKEAALDRGILEFVALFSGLVFKYGGRIVHGSHPTFTPIILRQARLHSGTRTRKPVTLIMSGLWAKDLSENEKDSMVDIAEFVVTKQIGSGTAEDADTRNRSLSAMREVLIDYQNVMVAVGGKMHSADGKIPGVGEEMDLAEKKGIPRFLIGGLGGFSETLAGQLTPSSLNNELTQDENVTLFGTNDVAACVHILFKHLSQSESLVKRVSSPRDGRTP